MGTVEMNLEELTKLIVRYCKAEHISEEDKYKFVLESLEKAQKGKEDK